MKQAPSPEQKISSLLRTKQAHDLFLFKFKYNKVRQATQPKNEFKGQVLSNQILTI